MIKKIFTNYILPLILCFPVLTAAEICFKPFEEDTTVAKAIFIGKVVKIQKRQFWHRETYKFEGEPKDIFTFRLFESFKGLSPLAEYLSLVGPINGCCNEHFLKDSTYLVFAYGSCDEAELLWTNDCSNTGLLSKRMDLYNKLGDGIEHPLRNAHLEIEIKGDSLVHTIDNLKSETIVITKENNRLRIITILMAVLSIILSALILIIKKRNA